MNPTIAAMRPMLGGFLFMAGVAEPWESAGSGHRRRPGGGVDGRALKLQEPNWVASSWSTALLPPGLVMALSWSASAGLLSSTSARTPSTIPVTAAAGSPQIVTRRQGPWPSALENSELPFCDTHASQ